VEAVCLAVVLVVGGIYITMPLLFKSFNALNYKWPK
jgi:hypothetical protein